MAKINPGATITPHFRDFLPSWVARQPWYRGSGVPALAMVGAYRLEDPDGEVGMEAHLLRATTPGQISDGDAVYHLPMTFRGTPLPDAPDTALITTAEHSVLGPRWIYDGPADPVWRQAIVSLVRDGGAARSRMSVSAVRGQPLDPGGLGADGLVIDVRRVLIPGTPAADTATRGLVLGTWRASGPGGQDAEVTGCLAVIRT